VERSVLKTKKLSHLVLFFIALSLSFPVLASSNYLRLQSNQYAMIKINEEDFCQLWYEGLNISGEKLWLYVADKMDIENILYTHRLSLGETYNITIEGTKVGVHFRAIVDANTVIFEVESYDPLKEISFTEGKLPSERPIELGSFLPAAAVLIAGVLVSAWCMVHGSTIGASAMVERPETSIWGLVTSVMGPIIMIFGFVSALMLMLPEQLGSLIFIAGEILVAAAILVVSVLSGLRNKGNVEETFSRVRMVATVFLGILGISSFIVLMSGGEGGGMIPVEAWRPLLGAVTMIGAALCAALCIMAAVKAGSAAMMEKPELSIWSLLFVALGEGLAIYGLIVAILIVTA
jgi:V/A-type H+-transporting ATPase subunit K